MKASQFSDAQKAFILKQGAEGVPVADICRKAGIEAVEFATLAWVDWFNHRPLLEPSATSRRRKPRALLRQARRTSHGGVTQTE